MTNPTPHGQVPEALRLAEEITNLECSSEAVAKTIAAAADELCRLHVENASLRAALAASPTPTAEQQAAPKAAPGEQNTVPAEWLEQAYREGWAACRDAETIEEEAEDWAFGNSTANSRMIDAQQAAPQQGAQEPVAWLNPWRADQVTTDYDAYGERGIPLYTAPQPAPALSDDVVKDAARYRWLRENWFTMTSNYQRGIAYTVGASRWSDITEEELDAAIDAAIAAQGGKV